MIDRFRLPCLLAAILSPAMALSADGAAMTVLAKESIARVEPGDAKQREVRLPALDVAVVASIECPGNATATSLIVSVSDTHHYFGPKVLADAVTLEAAFEVPARQLAPVVIPEFCVRGAPDDDQSLKLNGVATAQLSMRCSDENDASSIHFTSVQIPVRLYCLPDGEPAAPSADK